MNFDINDLNIEQVNTWLGAQSPTDEMTLQVVDTLNNSGREVHTREDGTLYIGDADPRDDSGAQPAPTQTNSGDMTEIIDILTQLISASGTVDADEVKAIIGRYLVENKIGMNDLDDHLQTLLTKEPQSFTIVLPDNWKKAKDDAKTEFSQPITDYIISDLNSKISKGGGGNNVYLYGGAGTGKTHIFKQIAAELLNVELITVNCNQFTSPTELIGGQTLDGYQQGKLIDAYASVNVPKDKNGYMILLDELPKLDPNTAGVLNDLLSSVRTGGTVSDGRLEKHERGDKQLFIVATGNTKLNEADPEYDANERQDMSLVDRFSGSMYRFVIDLQNESDFYSAYGCLFIWNYLCKLRFFLQERDYTNFGFVSRRLINSLVATTLHYFAKRELGLQKEAKTPQIGLDTFIDLFQPDQQSDIRENSGYKEFLVSAKKHMEDDKGDRPKNTAAEIKESGELVKKYTEEQKSKVAYLDRFGIE